MAIEANLREGTIQEIVAGRAGASPTTLKKIVDAWGTPDDYARLMELAGHPATEGRRGEALLDDEERELMRYYDQLSADDQKLLLEVARTFAAAERREGRPASEPAATAAGNV
jgi:hypothetical protein